jgi:hypothetical protein
MSSILRSIWDVINRHSKDHHNPAVLFEMSITNANKPPLDPMEVERQVDFFALLLLLSTKLPKDRAIILTNTPLFLQKMGILGGLVTNNDDIPGGSCPLSLVWCTPMSGKNSNLLPF